MTPYEQLPGMRWSSLKHMLTSPRLFRYRLDHPRTDTDALRLGRAIHCAVLEPERWASSYVAAPSVDRRTKAGKAEMAEFIASMPEGAEVLTAEQYAIAERAARSVREHARASEWLRGGRVEEVVTWTDEETGIECKSRQDFVTPLGVLDVKSTRRETLREILADASRLLYHGQLAYYTDGAIARRLVPPDSLPCALFVQTVEPYDVVPWRVSLIDLDRGRGLYRSLLRRYAECRAADWWPGLSPEPLVESLPGWTQGATDEAAEEDW